MPNELSGSNSFIKICYWKGKKVVIKQIGYCPTLPKRSKRISSITATRIIRDYLHIRKVISKCCAIPNLIDIYTIADTKKLDQFERDTSSDIYVRIVIIENYCGTSLKDLFLTHKLDFENLQKLGIEMILKMPEGIDVDTNPSNFTLLSNKVYFVDFIPPKVEEYQGDTDLENIFPQIKIRDDLREVRRRKRYKFKDDRISKYKIYCDSLLKYGRYINPYQPTPKHSPQKYPQNQAKPVEE